METIYERVERLRAENDIKSKLALEMDAGISNGAINKMRFHTPSLKTVEKLSKRLGVSVNYLLTGKTDDDPFDDPTPPEVCEKQRKVLRLLEGLSDDSYKAAIDYLTFLKFKEDMK